MKQRLISLVHRIPKWLSFEGFALTYTPTRPFFSVTVYGMNARTYIGFGSNITEAARQARKLRKEAT